MKMLVNKIKETIKNNNLINKGDRILIGLSGGADSVCLTHLLWTIKDEFDLEIYTAHLNHNIRGKDAENDAEYAKKFSKNLGIRCLVGSADVREYAKYIGASEELAGRELRYEFFNDVSSTLKLNKIATAHNRNDNAETIAMNFMRGTSLAGLCGIPYYRDNIIRPLLDITRAEIEEYCKENNLYYVTDSTNLENDYTRNKIRHYVLPLIEKEFNSNFINTVSKNAQLIKADEEYILTNARMVYNKIVHKNSVNIEEFLKCHNSIQTRIIRKMMESVMDMSNISSDYITSIIELAKNSKSGSSLNLPQGVTAKIEYEKLIINKFDQINDYEYNIKIDEELFIKEAQITIRIELTNERIDDGAQYFSGVDIDKIKIRNRRNGDYFYPAGMEGKKKLKDYFIDEKIPRDERNQTPIITFDGEIGYIVEKRRDERFKFTGKGIKIFILK